MDPARPHNPKQRQTATSRRGAASQSARRVPNLKQGTRTLAIGLGADGALPIEFRLFTAGWNDTENGRFLFDAESASAVMAAHTKWGVDLMIDLEHQALNAGTPSEPDARDARGWFRLELRSDGSLWATGVTWTPDGEARLRAKRQRYVSPAFTVDPDTSRVTAIINVALVAIPATHDTPALIAASAIGEGGMTLEEMMKVADALGLGPDATLDDFLAKIGTMKEKPEDEPVVEPLAVVDPEEKPEEVMAASARLMRLTGKTSFVDSIDEVEVWRTKALKADETVAQVAKERAILELAKRKENAVTLTKLGAETPHTSGLGAGKLCDRLLSEPLAEQTARVAALLSARGGKLSEVKAPAGAAVDGELNAREIAKCAAKKIDPAKYLATKNAMLGKA